MTWVIDSCVLLDIALADPAFAHKSALAVDRLRPQGLSVCPVSLIEIAPAFGGQLDDLRTFIAGLGLPFEQVWDGDDTRIAIRAWSDYAAKKRAGLGAKRPIADILVGAFAQRRHGLITRNVDDFANFHALKIVNPVDG